MLLDLEVLAALDPQDEYPLFMYFPADVFVVDVDTKGGDEGTEVLLVRTRDYQLITNERLLNEFQKISVGNWNYRNRTSVRIISIRDHDENNLFPKNEHT